MLVVVTKGVKKNFDVVLAAIVALEVRRSVCLFASRSTIWVCNEFICLYVYMLVMFPCQPVVVTKCVVKESDVVCDVV